MSLYAELNYHAADIFDVHDEKLFSAILDVEDILISWFVNNFNSARCCFVICMLYDSL